MTLTDDFKMQKLMILLCGFILSLGALNGAVERVGPAQLILDNGDRLTGEYRGTSDTGMISFVSPLLGELRVSSDKARVIIEGNTDESPLPVEPSDLAEDDPWEESTGGEIDEEAVEWDKPDVPGLAWIKYPKNWEGQLRFAFIAFEGQNSDFRFNFDNSITIPRENDSFEIQTRYDYETANEGSSKIRDRYDARLRYDHDISEDRFFQSETFYGADQVVLIDRQARQTLGYGFLWNGTEKYEFQVVPGLSGTYIEQENARNDQEWLILGRVFQSFNYKFNEHYAFNQTLEGFVEPEAPKNYELNLKVGLIGALTQKLALELDYVLDFDNTPATNIEQKQSRFRANLIFNY